MWLTITFILVAMITLAALELWFFRRLGERNDTGRRKRPRLRLSEAGSGHSDVSTPERMTRPPRRAA